MRNLPQNRKNYNDKNKTLFKFYSKNLMKKFLLPLQNMVRADLFSGYLAVWNVCGFVVIFCPPFTPSRALRRASTLSNLEVSFGGEAGIRTLGTLSSTPHFECGPFDHSGTSPLYIYCTCFYPNFLIIASFSK